MIRIALVCVFSTSDVRSHICETYNRDSFKLRERFGIKRTSGFDFAPWIPEIIKSFEQDDTYELHVIGLHGNMRRQIVRYEEKGIHYHFINANIPLWLNCLDRIIHFLERTDYKHFRRLLKKEINSIDPNMLCVCGAENPRYSTIALENFDIPTIVILQTLLNSKKRLQYCFGSPYRLSLERKIFSKVSYYWSYEPEAPSFIHSINRGAHIMRFMFPCIKPAIGNGIKKEYDFSFYAGGVSQNKGIEDAIRALSIVKQQYEGVKMDVVGRCSPDYRSILDKLIIELELNNNISFSGFFKEHSEVFNQVQKAKCVVVPGITAPLNSTVRESMFMGMPTITYRTEATDFINKTECNIIVAEMEDINDLAEKMKYVLALPQQEIDSIARKGLEYAEKHFSSEAVGIQMKRLLNVVYDNYYNNAVIVDDLQ